MKKIKKISSWIEKRIVYLTSALLMLIAVLICAQVLTRAFGISFSGSEELARYLYVSFVFLAWPIIALRGADLRISVLSDLLSQRMRTLLMAAFHIIMAAFLVVMLYGLNGKLKVSDSIVAASNTWFKMKWLYMLVGIGLGLTVLANVVRAILLVTNEETIRTQNEINEEEIAMELENTRVSAEEIAKQTSKGGISE